MAALVEFDRVGKDYLIGFPFPKPFVAVSNVSLNIEPGEVFGLVGPNRAGKTTLLKMMLNLCRITRGVIRRFGQPSSDRNTLGRIGYMHENQAFPRYLTPLSLLEYYGAFSKLTHQVIQQRMYQLVEQVGLADRRQDTIARFSKGMVQRLALAQALLNDPDLLVLDEPMEGLDLSARKLLHDLVRERRKQGKSVLIVSHSTHDIDQLCDRIGIVLGGKLAYLGSLADFKNDPKTKQPRSLETALHQLYDQSSS